MGRSGVPPRFHIPPRRDCTIGAQAPRSSTGVRTPAHFPPAGHLTRLGIRANYWTYVSGHSPFELTAEALCGAAGLLLGRGLLAPGRRTRAAALRAEARE